LGTWGLLACVKDSMCCTGMCFWFPLVLLGVPDGVLVAALLCCTCPLDLSFCREKTEMHYPSKKASYSISTVRHCNRPTGETFHPKIQANNCTAPSQLNQSIGQPIGGQTVWSCSIPSKKHRVNFTCFAVRVRCILSSICTFSHARSRHVE
jgi:hypothetical protein